MMIMKRTDFSNVFFFFLISICILFPQDPLNLKIPVLLIALLYDIVFSKEIEFDNFTFLVAFGIGVFFPVASFLLSLITGDAGIRDILSQAYPALIMFFLLKNKERIDLYRTVFFFLLRILSILIVVIFLCDFFGFQTVNEGLFQKITSSFGMGGIIKLHNNIGGYKIFLYCSPLIVFLLDHDFQDNRITLIAIDCAALFLSGTRANMLAMALYIVFVLYFERNNNGILSESKIFLGIILVFFILLGMKRIMGFIQSFISSDYSIGSDSIKIKQIIWFLNELKNPLTLLFGKGLGSVILDAGRGILTNTVEMMLFYYLYEIGILLFSVFLFFISYPMICRIRLHYKVAYLGFLVSALTNPILTTSTSYMVFLFMYSIIISKNNEQLEICHYE